MLFLTCTSPVPPSFSKQTTVFSMDFPRPPALWSTCWSWSWCPTAGAGRPQPCRTHLTTPQKSKDVRTYNISLWDRNFQWIQNHQNMVLWCFCCLDQMCKNFPKLGCKYSDVLREYFLVLDKCLLIQAVCSFHIVSSLFLLIQFLKWVCYYKKQSSTILVMAVPCHKPHHIHSHLCVRCVRNAPALDPALVGLSTTSNTKTLLFCGVFWCGLGHSVPLNLIFSLVNQWINVDPGSLGTQTHTHTHTKVSKQKGTTEFWRLIWLDIESLDAVKLHSKFAMSTILQQVVWMRTLLWIEPGLKHWPLKLGKKESCTS